MFGLEKTKKTVGPVGQIDAKIALVGEAPGVWELRAGKPFVGPAGSILDACLQNAGIVRRDCYITNVIKEHPPKNNITPWFNDRTGFTQKGQEYVEALREELEKTKANVFVALGKVAMCALTGRKDIITRRGYVMESTLLPRRKVLPTIHPSACLRGQYVYRYYIASDLKKALVESDFPEIRYPERTLIADPGITLQQALENLDFIASHKRVAFDIEVIEFQVSCISFATSPDWSFSLPLHRRWTEVEEAQLWQRIAAILEDPEIEKIGQNSLAFDCWFLATTCGIIVRGTHFDTMIGHSIIYPEMQKGLGFLASIYTHERYWKDMADFKSIKKED